MKLLLLSLLFASGCATFKPPVKREIVKSATIQSDYDKTWASVVRYFAENNITIKNIEKVSGLIATDTKVFAPFANDGMIDCGSLSGPSPATMNGSAIYNVFVEKIDTKSTRVTINLKAALASQIQVGYQKSSSERDCYSTGKFEADFFKALNK